MHDPTLPTIELSPPDPATASVIWLHGLGADGNDFVPAVPHLGLPENHGIRFLFPTAQAIPVTLNAGMVMPAWYDIRDLDLGDPRRSDAEGLRRSADLVAELVAQEIVRGISADRIVLAGFSQGGAVALHLGLRYPETLAGVLALSTYLVDGASLAAERSDANASTPVLMCHGTFDPMVPVVNGERARDHLQSLGYDLRWHAYGMQHEVCIEELMLIGEWLTERLAVDTTA